MLALGPTLLPSRVALDLYIKDGAATGSVTRRAE